MKRIILAVLGVLTVSVGVDAQSTTQTIERALLAAPARGRDATTVIGWNADYSYRTLKEGTNQLVCWDRSGDPGRGKASSQLPTHGPTLIFHFCERVSAWSCMNSYSTSRLRC